MLPPLEIDTFLRESLKSLKIVYFFFVGKIKTAVIFSQMNMKVKGLNR